MQQKPKDSSDATASLVALPEDLTLVKRRLEQPAAGDATPVSPTSSTSTGSSATTFTVQTAGSPLVRRESGGVIEEIGRNRSGLSWGVKHDRECTWREKWVEQSITQKQPGERPGELTDAAVTFGRSSGEDTTRHTAWTAEWREVAQPGGSSQRTVDKHVTHTPIDGPREEWSEKILTRREADETEVTEISKCGENVERGTRWQTQEKITRDSAGRELCAERSRTVADQEQHRTETRHSRDDGWSSRREVLIDRDKRKQQIYVEISSDGTEKGTETRHDPDGNVVFTAEWQNTAQGDRTRTETTFSRQKKREHRSGFDAASGETWNKVLETETETGDDGEQLVERSSVDAYYRSKDGCTWGDKETRSSVYREDGGREETTEREKWHDHSGERLVDNWRVTKHRNGATNAVEKCVESGTKTGTDRAGGGTSWGERWERVYDKSSELSSEERPLSPDAADCQELRLRSHFTDKWWDESGRNRWGERRFEDLLTKDSENCVWYANEREEQHDTWRVRGGVKSGEKRGWSSDGTRRWNEKWEGEQGVGDHSLDKSWEETRDEGEHVRWGELEGSRQGSQWTEKWGAVETAHGDNKRWLDRHTRHADGNEETEREGNERSAAGENWWSERYGTHNEEKWAVKKGGNERGEAWEDRWNERPTEKSASKSGRNVHGEWSEAWHEKDGVKWAEKRGKNYDDGDEWLETWLEEGTAKKTATKRGKNQYEEWEEKWGEEFGPHGGEKWADRWCRRRDGEGDAHGESWGERWNGPGRGGHKWCEKWRNGAVHEKWAHDTDGTPPQ